MTEAMKQEALNRIADLLSDLLKVLASPPVVIDLDRPQGTVLLTVVPTSEHFGARFSVRVFSEELDEYRDVQVDATVLRALRPDLDTVMNGWRDRHPDGFGVDVGVLGGRVIP